MKTKLLPEFPGKRLTKLVMRSTHLVFIAIISGGAFHGIDMAQMHGYWIGAFLTGLALLLIDALSNLIWFVQIRGIFVLIKLLLLLFAISAPNWSTSILLLTILLSGVLSHAPSHWRYYSLYHRRVLKSVVDIKG